MSLSLLVTVNFRNDIISRMCICCAYGGQDKYEKKCVNLSLCLQIKYNLQDCSAINNCN